MPSPLKPEFEWYLAHKDELLGTYKGRFVVIKNQKVIGAFDSEMQAISETRKTHELGTFLIQKVEPGDASTSLTFHSRVVAVSENAGV